jgi:DNA-binding NarL/FixJ family response regulator
MMSSVYVVEPQALFAPELARLVGEAGGRVAGVSAALDFAEIIAVAPDHVLLDLDFTSHDVCEVLSVLRVEAPNIRPIVLTAEREPGWIEQCRTAGAASVVVKAAGDELVHDLRVVLDGGAVWDPRVEAR